MPQENKDRAQLALRLAEEIDDLLACLTHEAFEMTEAGEFYYNPQVTPKALLCLDESLKCLRLAINEVHY
jgi:hypothetical protein